MISNVKEDGSPFRTTNPVALHFLNAFWPVNQVQIINQTIGIGRDLQDPLLHWLAVDWVAAPLRLAVNDFFIGDNRTAHEVRSPVDHDLIFIGQPLLVQLFKDPLRPLVVVWISRVDFAIPVIREAKRLNLVSKVIDVLVGEALWIVARL